MLISYSRKFIYVHIYRVAGTSIRDALAKYAYIPDRQMHLRLLRKMGVHRLVQHHRLEQFDGHSTAQEIKDKYIECRTPEKQRIAFVCKHLNRTIKVGFNEAFETFEDMELADDDDFQAWCDECEVIR